MNKWWNHGIISPQKSSPLISKKKKKKVLPFLSLKAQLHCQSSDLSAYSIDCDVAFNFHIYLLSKRKKLGRMSFKNFKGEIVQELSNLSELLSISIYQRIFILENFPLKSRIYKFCVSNVRTQKKNIRRWSAKQLTWTQKIYSKVFSHPLPWTWMIEPFFFSPSSFFHRFLLGVVNLLFSFTATNHLGQFN